MWSIHHFEVVLDNPYLELLVLVHINGLIIMEEITNYISAGYIILTEENIDRDLAEIQERIGNRRFI